MSSFLPIITVGVVLLIMTAVIVIIWALVRRDRKRADPVTGDMSELASLEGATVNGGQVIVERGALEFVFQQTTGKNPVFSTTLQIADETYPHNFVAFDERLWEQRFNLTHLPTVKFKRETRFRRIGKALGLDREVQTGDPEFDAAVYIDSTAPNELIELLCSEREVRESIQELLRRGYHNIEVFHVSHPIHATHNGKRPPPGLAKYTEGLLERFDRIARAMPSATTEKKTARTPSSVYVALLAVLMGIFGFFAFAFMVDAWPSFYDDPSTVGGLGGLAAWVVSLPLAYLIARGNSNGFGTFLFIVGAVLIGAPALGVSATSVSNAWLDASKTRTITATVTDTYISTGKTRTHYMTVEPHKERRRDRLPPIKLKIDSSTYYCASVGKKIKLEVRDGAFGWPYVQDWVVRCGR